jgi:hypothetical protein
MKKLCLLLLPVTSWFGCSAHDVKYTALIRNKMQPTPRATIVYGSIDESQRLMEQAALPHHPLRHRRNLERQAGQRLTDQLGSPDYLIIGEIHARGSDDSTPESLAAAVARRAAKAGGDVVLVYQSGVEDRPYVHTTPGHAHTTVWSTGHRHGPYRHRRSYAYTTYSPGYTYAGVEHYPFLRGLVFKYAPGVEQIREATYRLDDARLEQVMGQLEILAGDDSISFEEGLARWREQVGLPRVPTAPGVHVAPPPPAPAVRVTPPPR